jgi:hypothetical protein
VDPVVAAALISGGWATVIGALGYAYNRATTNATIEAANANAMNAIDAAHAAQHWEKRAEAYIDAMTAMTRRRARRDFITAPVQIGTDEDQAKALERITGPPDDNWAAASARVTVYATDEIRLAMEAANRAENQVFIRRVMYNSLMERSQSFSPNKPTGEQIMDAFEAIRTAAVAANDADSRVERLMQDNLGRRPSTFLREDSGREADRWLEGPTWQTMPQDLPLKIGSTRKQAIWPRRVKGESDSPRPDSDPTGTEQSAAPALDAGTAG